MTMRSLATGCLIAAGWFVGTLLTSTMSSDGSVTNDTTGPYRLSTYPDAPTYARCRHVHNPRLCDPDGVLKESTSFPLDDNLEQRNVTITTSGPQRGQVVPVQYGVAVMKKMDLTTTDGPDAMDGFADAPEQAAEIFARYIHDGWGVGHAAGTAGGTTGVLIFLSIEDRTVYFSRGLALERVLRDTRVDAVIETMKPFLRQKQYDQAVLAAIAELDMYLAAGPELDWEEWFANWFGTIVVFGMFGGFGICIYKDILDRRHYARVSTQLSDLDRARAEALQGTFKATSCPICLENFKKKECTVVHEHESEGEEAETAAASSEESTPLVDSEIDPTTAGDESSTDDELVGSDGLALKLLRCGHTFDETCWQEWISSGNSHSIHRCPICQQDVGEEQPDSTTSPLTVDPLSIPRGGHNDSDDNGQTMVRQQDVQINTTNYNAEHENGGSAEEIRRQLRSLAMRQYTTERNFRLLRLAARYPQYIQRNELQRWTQVSYNGSLAQEAQLARQAAETAKHSTSSWGNTSSSSGFGGGFSSGGRGGRW